MSKEEITKEKKVKYYFNLKVTETEKKQIKNFIARAQELPTGAKLRSGDVMAAILLTVATENIPEFFQCVRKKLIGG